MKKKESKSSAKKRGAEVTQLSNFRKGLTMNECSSCQACAPVLVKDSLLGHYLLSPKFRGECPCHVRRSYSPARQWYTPIESLFRSTYDLFIKWPSWMCMGTFEFCNHCEGAWDPSSFDEENDLTIYFLSSWRSMGSFSFDEYFTTTTFVLLPAQMTLPCSSCFGLNMST